MNLVGLDTMVLIHAARRTQPNDSPEAIDFRRRTIVLLANITKEQDRIIVPTVALSELLFGLKPEHRGPVIAKVNAQFIVKPLDIAAAAVAADLWSKHRGLPADDRMERRVLKVDVFAVASAKVAGAKIFYSVDRKCRTLASQAGMDARDLPTHSEDLLLDAEIRKEGGTSGIEPE